MRKITFRDIIRKVAEGIILNIKSGLGVSPIISVSYSVSMILGVNFGNMTFVLYTVFVLIEVLIHIALKKGQRKELLSILGKDLLYIGVGTVLSVIGVGRVIALFNHLFMGKLTKLAGM